MRLLALYRGIKWYDPITDHLYTDDQLRTSLLTSVNGKFEWSGEHKLDERYMTESGPALAHTDSWIWSVFRGSADEKLYQTFVGQILHWEGVTTLASNGIGEYYSEGQPALAWFRGQLYCAHRGTTGDERLWYTVEGPSGWSKDTLFSDTGIGDYYSQAGPALATYKDRLYCVHRGAAHDEMLWYTSTADGVHWDRDTPFLGKNPSRSHPALMVFQDHLWCVHRGGANDDSLYWTFFLQDQWVFDNQFPNHRSYAGPALAVFKGATPADDLLVCLHRGHQPDVGGDQNLWYTYAQFSLGTSLKWSTDTRLPNHRSFATPGLLSIDW